MTGCIARFECWNKYIGATKRYPLELASYCRFNGNARPPRAIGQHVLHRPNQLCISCILHASSGGFSSSLSDSELSEDEVEEAAHLPDFTSWKELLDSNCVLSDFSVSWGGARSHDPHRQLRKPILLPIGARREGGRGRNWVRCWGEGGVGRPDLRPINSETTAQISEAREDILAPAGPLKKR
jgi:hypothetical protein